LEIVLVSRLSLIIIILGGIIAVILVVIYPSYQNDIHAARERVMSGSQVIETKCGPIEYATTGEGPPVLVVHGAGGGYDQGLWIARDNMDEGFRIIAPSRFGYLRTPLPQDASPAAQADAHACLLDALNISKVAVLGVSAGAPSSMQFALRFPERTSSLVLIVPGTYSPENPVESPNPVPLPFILSMISKSDFPLWVAMKVYPSSVLFTVGVPPSSQAMLTDAQKDELMRSLLPFSPRIDGMVNEAKIASALDRYPLENITAPTLVISAVDDPWKTFDAAQYTAENIPGAKFIGFETGGHLLIGQKEEVRSDVVQSITQHAIAG
jgi:2-hydroxy-6-oxonona-2,4-dienedioate hydrolase